MQCAVCGEDLEGLCPTKKNCIGSNLMQLDLLIIIFPKKQKAMYFLKVGI